MKGRRLSRRLGYLSRYSAPKPEPASVGREFLDQQGWIRVAEHVYHRTVAWEDPLGDDALSPILVPSGIERQDLLFFDTETTGLSGGAGNMVFLIGMGSFQGSSLQCRQVFLADFPGEVEFLSCIEETIKEGRLFISFNGKSFDSHMLRGRFLMNGLVCELELQLDLLHWARRLWKRSLGDCSLGSIEARILGLKRPQDVPGYEVPGIYLEYLRSGRPGQLDKVFSHNLQDTETLVRLFTLINRILTSSHGLLETTGKIPAATDLATLGTYLLKYGSSQGLEVLKAAYAGGDQSSGLALSLFYKRQGRWNESVELWKALAASDPAGSRNPPLRRETWRALIELAKYYEHRHKDFRQALHWLTPLLSAVSAFPESSELDKRKSRLERKLSPKPDSLS